MKTRAPSERGQALILIVFGIVGLIGMVALTVDGGNAYSDRRHAQNAADTAVLAGARAIVRVEDWKLAALALASANGYQDTDDTAGTTETMSNVEVYRCDEADPAVDCGLYDIDVNADAADYIQAKITSRIDTYFAPVIGIQQVTNVVTAIAKVIPGEFTESFMGEAIVGLSPHDCEAVKYQGTADTLIVGGGLYSNSDCPDKAFFNQSGSAALTAPSICAVGGVTYVPSAMDVPSISEGCQPHGFPPDNMVMPNPTCGGLTAVKTGSLLSQGNFSGTFPPNGVTNLESGTYCVDGDFRLNAGDVLTGIEVLIVVDGDIVWNGAAEPHLSPPSTGDFKGLLLYVPMGSPIDYTHSVSINGNSSSDLSGTILAPAADCSINGTGDLEQINGQVICYTVVLSGTAGITLVYNDLENWNTLEQPTVQLTE